MIAAVARGLRAFGRFWWDFLIGETPELFVGALVVVGIAFALHRHRLIAVVVVPVVAVVFVAGSVWRGRARPAQ